MVPYITVLKARLSARFHVQVELTRVPQDFQTPAAIPVEGCVLQIFRGDSSLSLGDKLIFEIHICQCPARQLHNVVRTTRRRNSTRPVIHAV
jgi:hypothetical protein